MDKAARPLRFGIMCRGTTFPAWEAKCIEALIAEGAEPALLIVDESPLPRTSFKQKLTRLLKGRMVLWRLYQRMVLNRRSRSTVPVDLSDRLAGVPVVECRPEAKGKFTQRFADNDVEAVRAHDLDFVLRFAFNIIRGEMLDAPRYGIWSFHHGDPEKYRGTPPGFWEIATGDPVTGAILQRLNDRLDAGVVLKKGYFRTLASSYPRNRDQIFLGAAEWPAQVCRDIRNGAAGYFDNPPLAEKAPIYRDPGNVAMLRFLFVWLKAAVGNQIESLFRHQQWGVGVADAPIHALFGLGAAAPQHPAVKWLEEPPGRFLADPFALPRSDGGLAILAEDLDWSTMRGRISVVESRDGIRFDAARLVLDRPFHLSYPYLFEHEGGLYCIPEANEAREAALYRLDETLTEWRKVAALLEGTRPVDSTIFHHDDRWWLFCTDEADGPNTRLLAWHAAELTGPWQPHGGNPIKTDVRSARPAGTPFVHEGQLYRPAQDCSTGYGAAVVLNRIDRLTPTEFSETAVAALRPDPNGPYPDGLHTVSAAGDRTVIDGNRRTFVRQAFAYAMREKRGRLTARFRN